MQQAWKFYSTNELKPDGWLKRQLALQAAGLNGNLDKMWRDVRDSAWIGKDAEGWERVPYWLDGFIPLAYLLEDADMIARAKAYIDAIIARRCEDGWLCPCKPEERSGYDIWALLLITKVLTVYYECSRDERIPDVVYRALQNCYRLLSDGDIRLFSWGKYRWFEGLIAIRFVYERCREPWLVELAKLLRQQGADYREFIALWKRPLNKWTFETHIVNLAMMLKSECLCCELLGEEYTDLAESLHAVLDQFNGTPVGLFTGDECLSGLSPIQGTELCAVVEQMYSYELLYACTGEAKWAQRLELLAFNALPATFSDDMWAHQYVQMSNQIDCRKFPGKSLFRTNNAEAHLFGLEPHYGCCTANFGQGWPKFALSAFLHRGNEILSALPIPSRLDTDELTVTLETNYPFEHTLSYHIESRAAHELVFCVRIPDFAENLCLNGAPAENTGLLRVAIPAGQTRELQISFSVKPQLVDRPHQLKTARCGSLVFSLPIRYEKKMHEYTENGVERKYPYCDYEYLADSSWSYGYADAALSLIPCEIADIPFSSQQPPVMLRANVQEIDWGLEDGYKSVCAKVPQSRVPLGQPQSVLLYPYGCAKLRMTELPLLSESETK